MQVSGRIVILATFGIAVALSGGAWWYHYQTTRRAAEFWGATGAHLLVKAAQLELLELGQRTADGDDGPMLAGRTVVAEHDLSRKPGLVHLRFVFTQDANFLWEKRRREPVDAAPDWAYALRFTEGEQVLVVLLRRDFQRVGKLAGKQVEVLPSPRIERSVRQYLTDVGVLQGEAAAR